MRIGFGFDVAVLAAVTAAVLKRQTGPKFFGSSAASWGGSLITFGKA